MSARPVPRQNTPEANLSPSRHTYAIDDHLIGVTLHEPAYGKLEVPEALVQDIWRTQLFEHEALCTAGGEPLHVIHPGAHNHDSGPDFSQAHLHIGGIEWHGDVEVHVRSAGWYVHGHHEDQRSNRVVLHVTLYTDEHTGTLRRPDGSVIPELVLRPHLRTPLRGLLHRFNTAPSELPCANRWSSLPDSLVSDWVEYLAIQRLAHKVEALDTRSAERGNSSTVSRWDVLLREGIFAALGYVPNSDAMRMLAERLPLTVVQQIDDPRDLEALHLGMAGLLPAPDDLLDADRATADYAVHLTDRFERLCAVYPNLLKRRTLERTTWKFFRLRPANFPSLRIAQAAALAAPGGLLHRRPFDAVLHAVTAEHPLRALRALFACDVPHFWTTHYRLDRSSKPHDASLGTSRIDTIITNAVLPLLHLYAETTGDKAAGQHAMDLLRTLPPSRNIITRIYADLGYAPSSTLETQGLHHLHQAYCQPGRCLSCAIGMHLLGKDNLPVPHKSKEDPAAT